MNDTCILLFVTWVFICVTFFFVYVTLTKKDVIKGNMEIKIIKIIFFVFCK